jgi:hypothetical protein
VERLGISVEFDDISSGSIPLCGRVGGLALCDRSKTQGGASSGEIILL